MYKGNQVCRDTSLAEKSAVLQPRYVRYKIDDGDVLEYIYKVYLLCTDRLVRSLLELRYYFQASGEKIAELKTLHCLRDLAGFT